MANRTRNCIESQRNVASWNTRDGERRIQHGRSARLRGADAAATADHAAECVGKVFDRSDFTPGEVARLGHRRIERAEGIGRKGLATIIEWLRCHGFELADDTLGSQSRTSANSPKEVKKVEKAMRVLQIHGYTILRSEQSEDGDTVGCTSPKTPGVSA
jgi:GNAT superfamily N-acetyltransferase